MTFQSPLAKRVAANSTADAPIATVIEREALVISTKHAAALVTVSLAG
jgi:hypothetical protein